MPSITSHPDIALPMAIFSTIPYIDNWLCSEFLQVYSNGIYTKRYNYGSCEIYEPLECIRIPYHISIGNDIVDFFISLIKNDYYVLVFCDDSRISSMNIHYPRLHGILLFGFDEDNKTFDAFAYNGVKLQYFKVSFNDIIRAYNSDFSVNFQGRGRVLDEQINEIHKIDLESHMLMLYKIKESNYKDYNINLGKIKWHMLDYLESINTMSREVPHFGDEVIVWGMDVYDEVKKYYKYQSQRHKHIFFADPYCIYEHKKDWLRKLQYIHDNSELKCSVEMLNNLDKLVKQSRNFINLIIKYNMKRREDTTELMNHIFLQLDRMKELEKSTLSQYYEFNRKVFESF